MSAHMRSVTAGISALVFAASILSILPWAHADGTVKSVSQYEFWDKGKMRRRDVYDLNGKLRIGYFFRVDGTIEKMEKYNADGNRIEEAFYDNKGGLKTGIDGWAAMRWFYGGSCLVWQVSYDESGKPLQRLVFSESGKLIDRQYRKDIDIDPYEFINTAAIIAQNREDVYGTR